MFPSLGVSLSDTPETQPEHSAPRGRLRLLVELEGISLLQGCGLCTGPDVELLSGRVRDVADIVSEQLQQKTAVPEERKEKKTDPEE